MTHQFNDKELEDIIWGGLPEGWKIVKKFAVVATTRWNLRYAGVITNGESYYEISYSTGATEYQEADYDFTVAQVWPYEKTITVYSPIHPEESI